MIYIGLVKKNKFKFDLNHNQPLRKSVKCSYIFLHSNGCFGTARIKMTQRIR